jgi:hypothetical protein
VPFLAPFRRHPQDRHEGRDNAPANHVAPSVISAIDDAMGAANLDGARAALEGLEREQLRALFAQTGSTRLARLIFSIYFNVNITPPPNNKAGFREWSIRGLRRAFQVLDALPREDLLHENWKHMFRTRELAGGSYDWNNGVLVINYREPFVSTRLDVLHVLTQGRRSRGPLRRRSILFDVTTRHEAGHVLDDREGYSTKYNPAGWRGENASAVIDILWAACKHEKDVTDEADQEAVKDLLFYGVLAGRPRNRKDVETRINLHLNGAKTYTYGDQLLTNGRTVKYWAKKIAALDISGRLIAAQTETWRRGDGGAGLGLLVGDRIYLSDEDGWKSYLAAARARGVSDYQFKSQKEWFAEAYAAYYEPKKRHGVNVLESVDPETSEFIRTRVIPDQVPPRDARLGDYDDDDDDDD